MRESYFQEWSGILNSDSPRREKNVIEEKGMVTEKVDSDSYQYFWVGKAEVICIPEWAAILET